MNPATLPDKPDRCGKCTLCCTLFDVPQLNKSAGKDCPNCILNQGCKIWQKRPQVCRDFKCAYYQMDKVHLDLRPDNCKMIFEKVSDNIFFGTQDPRFKITKVAKGQVRNFLKQGVSVILASKNQEPAMYIADDHTEKEIKQEYKQYLINWEKENGGAFILH